MLSSLQSGIAIERIATTCYSIIDEEGVDSYTLRNASFIRLR